MLAMEDGRIDDRTLPEAIYPIAVDHRTSAGGKTQRVSNEIRQSQRHAMFTATTGRLLIYAPFGTKYPCNG